TTRCDGKQLRRLYYRRAWRWPTALGELRISSRKCGEWLGRFHNGSRRAVETALAMENRLRHLDRMISEIDASGSGSLAPADLERLQAIIRRGVCEPERTWFGRVHGNYTLRNILVSNAGVVPVDFEDSREEAIQMDTGQFIADILLSAYRPYIRDSLRQSLTAEFVSSYTQHVPVDVGQVKCFALYHVLAAYYEILARKTRQGRPSLLALHQERV